jgi:hypothetical protein
MALQGPGQSSVPYLLNASHSGLRLDICGRAQAQKMDALHFTMQSGFTVVHQGMRVADIWRVSIGQLA